MNDNDMIDKIIDFLCRAKRKTYAGKGKEIASSRNNSHDLRYAEDDLEYYDSYLGSEKFAGEEGLWKKRCPMFSPIYLFAVRNYLQTAIKLMCVVLPETSTGFMGKKLSTTEM